MTTKTPSPDEMRWKRIAYDARHAAGDAQWLADLLFRKAGRGDRRSRRLLCRLFRLLQSQGAAVPQPTWPKIESAHRLHELDL